MQKVVLVLLAVWALSFSAAAHAIGSESLQQLVIENQKGYPSWYVGKGIVPGESFDYHICDRTMKSTLNGAATCYRADLDFVSLLQDHTGGVWIVQATFTPDGSKSQWPAILHITEDFGTITTDGETMNYATSLSHTLLYMQKYANMYKPQKLEIGSSWGYAEDFVSDMPQLTVTRFTSIETGYNSTGVYEIGYDVVKENTVYIKDGFPFPIEQTIYDSLGYNSDPPVLYQIRLMQTGNMQNNVYQGMKVNASCPNPLFYGPVSNDTISQNTNSASQTQLQALPINRTGIILPDNMTLQNNTATFGQNYTQPFNVTSK
ncbi:MAG: hypothetical protein KGI33_12570 [Thaumarchaeota archaeon]|nr:hypothetical protein [Nitrososphaerota archaeon]